MIRMRLFQAWFAAVTLSVVSVIASGVTMTVGTAGSLVMLTLAPAAMVLLLWPRVQPRTAAAVLYDRNRPA